MKRLLFVGLATMVVCACLWPQGADAGQSRLGRSVLHVLKVEQSARISGLGGTFVSLADDVNAIFVNPAGLTHVENGEFLLSYNRWLVDSKFYTGALAYNVGSGVLGLSVMAHQPKDIQETTIFQPLGTGRILDAGDISIGVAFARKLTDKLSFGALVRWTQETLDVDRISSVDVTLGSVFYTGFRSLRLAMSFANLGPDERALEMKYHLPVAFTFGFAGEIYGDVGEQAYLTVTGESYYATDVADPQYRIGGELWFQNALALRAGYKFNYDEESYSAGLGVKFTPAEGRELRADFSYSDFGGVFDAPLRFTLSGAF